MGQGAEEAIGSPGGRRRGVAWSLWLVAAVSLCVIVPRTLLIAHAHNEAMDDEYHLARGLAFFEDFRPRWTWNDPPTGEALLALPAWLTVGDIDHWTYEDQWQRVIYNHPLGPERLLMLLAAWKALLTIPLPLVIFAWCRQLYGVGAAWLAVALVLVEPTFTAHTAYLGLDTLGVTTLLLACWLGWRYMSAPTWRRLAAASLGMSLALVTKHTAIILPAVLLLYAIFGPGSSQDSEQSSLRLRLNRWAAVVLLALPMMWALLGFDISEPRLAGRQLTVNYQDGWTLAGDVINPISRWKLPGGIYLGSFLEAYNHGLEGHPTYLFGQIGEFAPWYHQLAVATYKVPLGVAAVLVLGLVSLAWARPRAGEMPLLVGAVAWGAFILTSGLGIGFRHFLPIYVFLLMLAARCVQGGWPAQGGRRVVWALAWLGVAAAVVDGLRWHPNYMSYLNWPRDRAYLDISDSNVDWGQGVKQVARWLEANPQDRPVTVIPFNRNNDLLVAHYIGPGVRVQGPGPLPGGILIISKSLVPGVYSRFGNNRLREADPVAEIGASMLVYDLDALRAGGLDP